jgi:hypothetical protein
MGISERGEEANIPPRSSLITKRWGVWNEQRDRISNGVDHQERPNALMTFQCGKHFLPLWDPLQHDDSLFVCRA